MPIHYALHDGIAEITLDQAPVNALTEAMVGDLLAALRHAGADSAARAAFVPGWTWRLCTVRRPNTCRPCSTSSMCSCATPSATWASPASPPWRVRRVVVA